MIAWLRGAVLHKHPDSVVIDVGGVGYLVSISQNSYGLLPAQGATVAMEVITYVREDQISLFGFVVPGEKEAFKHLLVVTGIGPKVALGILSGLLPDELAQAVAKGDLKRLQAAPGVGKKTAERILIELKDKLTLSGFAPSAAPVAVPGSLDDDLALALSGLGYKKAELDRVLPRVPRPADVGIEVAIREALKLLQPR